jgi:hypothetical protein
MSATLNFIGPLKTKAENIKALLAGRFGILISGKKCITVILKDTNLMEASINLPGGTTIYVMAICGSAIDSRNFEGEFRQLQDYLKNVFSIRDLNMFLVRDFISDYLSSEFYNRRSDRPVALEFIVGEVTNSAISFCAVGYDGNMRDGDSRISVIGCESEEERATLISVVEKCNILDKPAQSMIKKVETALVKAGYEGNYKGFGWDMLKPKEE